MPEEVQIPLHLCQVLEEEFENLHEKLDWRDEGDPVFVPDDDEDDGRVSVLVKSDWNFHHNHVRRARLARRLNTAYEQWKNARPAGQPAPDEREVDRSEERRVGK